MLKNNLIKQKKTGVVKPEIKPELKPKEKEDKMVNNLRCFEVDTFFIFKYLYNQAEKNRRYENRNQAKS